MIYNWTDPASAGELYISIVSQSNQIVSGLTYIRMDNPSELVTVRGLVTHLCVIELVWERI